MDFDLFKKVIDEVVESGIPTVRLQFFGEPLLHPRLVEMINYAKDNGVECVNFNTNVSLLNEKIAREILNTKLDQIQFSLDANTEKTFDLVRSEGFFNQVINNIETFFRLKSSLKKDSPHTVLKATATKDNLAELPDMVNRWGNLFDEIQIAPMTIYEGLDFSFEDKKQFLKDICMEPFQKLVIFWNGDVSVCCYDINGYLKIGSVLEQSLLKLWRNPAINKLRTKMKNRQYDDIACCKDCEFPNKRFLNHSAQSILKDSLNIEHFDEKLNSRVSDGVLYITAKDIKNKK